MPPPTPQISSDSSKQYHDRERGRVALRVNVAHHRRRLLARVGVRG
jgi:hypothetical protein